MAVSFSLTVLLLALITTTSIHLISAAETSPPPVSTTHTPPAAAAAKIQQKQLNNIIEALIGSGDFAVWAGLLAFTDPSFLPLNATFFIPSNDAISHFSTTNAAAINFDPFLIPYHIIPQRLTFSDLQRLTTHTRLPTLLPYKSIIITNNCSSNFTVDDSQITQADIVLNAAFSVHGVKKILEYSVYGGDSVLSPPPGNSISLRRKRSPDRDRRKKKPPEGSPVGMISAASCWCSEILMVFLISCAVFVFDII